MGEPRDEYVRGQSEPYHVEGWNGTRGSWWVMARNGRTMATCNSRRTAQRIVRLLNAEAVVTGSSPTGGSADA